MEVRIADLGSVPRRVEFSEPVEGMNRQLALSPGCTGQHFDEALKVAAELQLCGDDVVVTGRLEGGVTGDCPRCLDEFFRGINRDFRLVVERFDRGTDAESSAVASHDGDRLDETAERLCKETGAEVVQKIGKVLLLWRQNKEEPKITLPKS